MGHVGVRLTGLQVAAILLCSVFFLLIATKNAVLSASLGGFVSMVANLYFSYKMYHYRGAWEPKKVLSHFYRAEIVKTLLVVSLFFLIFRTFGQHIALVPFIVTYIVSQAVYWCMPIGDAEEVCNNE